MCVYTAKNYNDIHGGELNAGLMFISATCIANYTALC